MEPTQKDGLWIRSQERVETNQHSRQPDEGVQQGDQFRHARHFNLGSAPQPNRGANQHGNTNEKSGD